MGLLGGDSKANQTQQTATDQGQITGKKGTGATQGSFAVGAGARYTESGSTQIGGNVTNSGGNVTAAGSSTVNVGLGGSDIGSLIDKFTSSTKDQLSAFKDAFAPSSAPTPTVGDLTKPDATQPGSSKNLWIVGAVVVLLILVAFKLFKR